MHSIAPIRLLVQSKMPSDFDENWLGALEVALNAGVQITIGGDQLNVACDHIVGLLLDASNLLQKDPHATVTLLAITALEEIGCSLS